MKSVTSVDEINTTPIQDAVNYHLVWFGEPIDHLLLCVASLFHTQANPIITLWTSDTYVDRLRDRMYPLFPKLRVDVFRSVNEGVLYPKEPEDKFWTCDDWRLDILYTHGGIYIDVDTLALRDVSWVTRYRAMSRWGLDEKCNTSLAAFPKGDPELRKLLLHMGTIGNRKGWHRSVPNIDWNLMEIDILCFHPRFFDCGWGGGGLGCDAFFTSLPNTPDPFVGSFLYHWHNRWNMDVRNPDTLVGQYWKKLCGDLTR